MPPSTHDIHQHAVDVELEHTYDNLVDAAARYDHLRAAVQRLHDTLAFTAAAATYGSPWHRVAAATRRILDEFPAHP